jgi:hypothetical protein
MCNFLVIKLVGYMPDLGGTANQRNKTGYGEALREFYHECLRRIICSVAEARRRGGIWAQRASFMVHVMQNITSNVTML